MTEKTIHILGEDIRVRFNMAVEIAYEEIAGEPFTLDGIKYMKGMAALAMAVVIVNNPDTTITMERLTKEATGQEVGALNVAAVEAMTEWLTVPKVEQTEEPEQQTGEDAPKN